MKGATLFGVVGDIAGRKRTFIVTHCVCLVFGIMSALASSYEIYCVYRMLTGAGVSGLGLLAFIVPAEVIGVNGNRGFWLTTQSAIFGCVFDFLDVLSIFESPILNADLLPHCLSGLAVLS